MEGVKSTAALCPQNAPMTSALDVLACPAGPPKKTLQSGGKMA
jgi:hypothetical protein